MLANYQDVHKTMIRAIVDGKINSQDFIANEVERLRWPIDPQRVPVFCMYRLVMKQGRYNFISWAIPGVMKRLKAKWVEVFVYEPVLT